MVELDLPSKKQAETIERERVIILNEQIGKLNLELFSLKLDETHRKVIESLLLKKLEMAKLLDLVNNARRDFNEFILAELAKTSSSSPEINMPFIKSDVLDEFWSEHCEKMLASEVDSARKLRVDIIESRSLLEKELLSIIGMDQDSKADLQDVEKAISNSRRTRTEDETLTATENTDDTKVAKIEQKKIETIQTELKSISEALELEKMVSKTHKREVLGLQSLIESLSPLITVGWKIRMRFLEKGKQDMIDGKFVDVRGSVNQSIIEAGNFAAHRADIQADIALFSCQFVGSTQPEHAAFSAIYVTKATNISSLRLSPRMTEVSNMDANIRYMRRNNKTLLDLRDGHLLCFKNLYRSCRERFDTLRDNGELILRGVMFAFEGDPEAKTLVEEMKIVYQAIMKNKV